MANISSSKHFASVEIAGLRFAISARNQVMGIIWEGEEAIFTPEDAEKIYQFIGKHLKKSVTFNVPIER